MSSTTTVLLAQTQPLPPSLNSPSSSLLTRAAQTAALWLPQNPPTPHEKTLPSLARRMVIEEKNTLMQEYFRICGDYFGDPKSPLDTAFKKIKEAKGSETKELWAAFTLLDQRKDAIVARLKTLGSVMHHDTELQSEIERLRQELVGTQGRVWLFSTCFERATTSDTLDTFTTERGCPLQNSRGVNWKKTACLAAAAGVGAALLALVLKNSSTSLASVHTLAATPCIALPPLPSPPPLWIWLSPLPLLDDYC